MGSDALLLTTATIWGFAFVAQRAGMEHVGPFIFNAVRFALGAVSLLPVLFISSRLAKRSGHQRQRWEERENWSVPIIGIQRWEERENWSVPIIGILLTGFVLFVASSLQQVGIVYTTAGKAGFITGLYVLFVPLFGLVRGQRLRLGTAFGAIMALAGLYFLSMDEKLTLSPGDGLVLVGAAFWAIHVLLIDWLVNKMPAIHIAIGQFTLCSLLSLGVSVLTEEIVLVNILQAAIPILYGGIMSVGVAYTLQLVAQKNAHPAHAAIILSLEAVFALLGGWLILGETVSTRDLLGCTLMMSAMLASQLHLLGMGTDK